MSSLRGLASIEACLLPDGALLSRYTSAGAYTDCYATEIAAPVSQADFIEAFYTGSVFKVERLLIGLALSKPSTDAEVRQLAAGERRDFAAWRVEDRTADQILMCDLNSRTRSWLMVEPVAGGTDRSGTGFPGTGVTGTRLYFGSAVVPVRNRTTGEARMGFPFSALLGFHKVYSRVLLGAARDRLLARR